jgi:hypothetical protein
MTISNHVTIIGQLRPKGRLLRNSFASARGSSAIAKFPTRTSSVLVIRQRVAGLAGCLRIVLNLLNIWWLVFVDHSRILSAPIFRYHKAAPGLHIVRAKHHPFREVLQKPSKTENHILRQRPRYLGQNWLQWCARS